MKKYQLIEKRYDKEQNSVGNFKDRYFFRKDDDETCWKLNSHIDYMLSNGLTEMDLYLAERETNAPFFYCLHFGSVGEKSGSECGKFCEGYQPRNGKSGICKHYGYTYEKTDRGFTLKLSDEYFSKVFMSLYQITNYTSGIIIYPDGTKAAVYWGDMNGIPRLFAGAVVNLNEDLEVISKNHISQSKINEYLPLDITIPDDMRPEDVKITSKGNIYKIKSGGEIFEVITIDDWD